MKISFISGYTSQFISRFAIGTDSAGFPDERSKPLCLGSGITFFHGNVVCTGSVSTGKTGEPRGQIPGIAGFHRQLIGRFPIDSVFPIQTVFADDGCEPLSFGSLIAVFHRKFIGGFSVGTVLSVGSALSGNTNERSKPLFNRSGITVGHRQFIGGSTHVTFGSVFPGEGHQPFFYRPLISVFHSQIISREFFF